MVLIVLLVSLVLTALLVLILVLTTLLPSFGLPELFINLNDGFLPTGVVVGDCLPPLDWLDDPKRGVSPDCIE